MFYSSSFDLYIGKVVYFWFCCQVESGFITTGTSVLIEGTVVSSQGSKQKVELKVATLILVSEPMLKLSFVKY